MTFPRFQGIAASRFLPSKTLFTCQYYASVMAELKDAMREMRRGKLKRGMLRLHENAPPHKTNVTLRPIRQWLSEKLPRPPQSPELAPSDCHLLRKFESDLKEKSYFDDYKLRLTVGPHGTTF
jgi:hypothetical protein